jgi:nicotinate phosphoribosyltransferase
MTDSPQPPTVPSPADAGRRSDPGASPLLTDLYELTMLQTYYEHGMTDTAVFELFFRRPPRGTRNFLIAAGLEQLLDFLEQLRFSEDELEWVAGTRRFRPQFVGRLRDLRFTGEVHALPEGTACFPDEPVVRVTAPLPEAQLVESRLLNILHFQTLIASKAARAVLQAPDKLLVDFGMRRAHGAEAALYAARATYLAGFSGSATVLAGQRYGVPVFGTMAHSFIQAHASEALAFERFARSHPNATTLLIDTYDTEAAARKLVQLAPRLAAEGIRIRAVRLDSGDLAEHAFQVRAILDAGGLPEVQIFASSGLEEHALHDLLRVKRAPIDGFGIGSAMDTSQDLPSLDCVYKLQEYAGRARRKRSEGKATWPGRKQVYRRFGADGEMLQDNLGLESEGCEGEPLLQLVMRDGQRLPGLPSLSQAREHCRMQLARLPEALRGLAPVEPYPVSVSAGVRALAEEVDRQQAADPL